TTVGIPNVRLPPLGFGISTFSTGWGIYVPSSSSSLMRGQCSLRYPSSWSTVIPSTPGAPLLDTTRRKAAIMLPRLTVSSISRAPASVQYSPSVAVTPDTPLPYSRDFWSLPSGTAPGFSALASVFARVIETAGSCPLLHVRPFAGRLGRLVWPLLTSAERQATCLQATLHRDFAQCGTADLPG